MATECNLKHSEVGRQKAENAERIRTSSWWMSSTVWFDWFDWFDLEEFLYNSIPCLYHVYHDDQGEASSLKAWARNLSMDVPRLALVNSNHRYIFA
jgi:hypothetical protein